jgi:N-acetyl-anhydromuramyl-L-alanine amidase AmpD
MFVETWPSPNHSTRGGNRVRALVIHATAGEWDGALAWLRNPASRVSAHYLVGRDGRVAKLVEEGRTAWHAGVSQWQGLEVWSEPQPGVRVPSLNPVSVGIELVNRNDGRDPYPPAQQLVAAELARDIVARHQIPRDHLVRHLDIAPGRKTDPAGLPWAAFVEAVYGAAPLPPAGTPHRCRWRAYVRSAPSTVAGIVTKLDRGSPVTVRRLVAGELVANAAGTSNQWAELATGGYMWAPQLEAL